MQKHEQIGRAREAFARLLNAIDGMDEQALTTPGLDAWSVREILAHIAGWMLIDTRIMRRLGRGERPLPEGEQYGTGDSRNPGYAAGAASKSAAIVVDELRKAFDAFLSAAESVPEDRFSEGRTAQRLMQESALQHLHEHSAEIETYRAASGA
jgi:hypothetical protein